MSRVADEPIGLVNGARQHGTFIRRVSGDVLRISGAVGLAQVLVFAASPLLTRLYGPEAFGHFTVLSIIVTTLTPLASLRYGWALPLPREDAVARDLLSLCLVVTFGFAVLTGLVGTLAWAALEGWVAIGIADVGLLAVAMLVIGLHEVATSWLVRVQAFRQVAGVRFVTLVGTIVWQIVFAVMQPGAASLMLGFIGGYLMGLFMAAYHFRDAVMASVRGMDAGRLRHVAVEYRRFALVTAPSGVVNGLGSLLPAMALPSLYGLAVTGQWSLAGRLLWQPMNFIGQAVNQVLWGTAARLQHENPKRLWVLFLTLNVGLAALMAPSLILFWYGEDLFALVFGAAWAEAGRYAGIMVLASIVSLAAQSTTSLHIYGLNHWMSAWEVSRLLVFAAVLALCWGMELPAIDCIIALTATTAAVDAALLALNALAVWRIKATAGRTAPASAPEGRPHAITPKSSA